MLRKDVKLGFAIGGVMLAVVVVYVLVVPNNDKKSGGPVIDESASQAPSQSLTPAGAPDSKSTEAKVDKPGDAPADNVGEKPMIAVGGPTTAPTDATAANGSANSNVWDIALKEGHLPPAMSATPTAAAAGKSADDKQSDAQPVNGQTPTNDNVPAGAPIAANDGKTGDNKTGDSKTGDNSTPDTNDARLAGATTAGNSKAGSTHVVQPGETLSSIAAASYGDAKAWKRISDANPQVNPNRLSAGTHLVIPQASAMANSPKSQAVDSQTQYQVQANDSLYRISMHLYGKADHVQKLYEQNKDVIGADPRHLKLGMILKLTDPPAASVTNAAR